MIGYKDKTWCNKSYTCDKKCERRLTEKERKKAEEWWGDNDFPVQLADFSDACEMFKEEK